MGKKAPVSIFLVICIIATTLNFTSIQSSAAFAGGMGTESNPYIITTQSQLLEISNYPTACFKLANDIYMTNTISGLCSANKAFSGKLDGNYKTIHDLHVSGRGLFNNVKEGTIMNLNLNGGGVNGTQSVGSFVGRASINLNLINCSSNLTVYGTNLTGGLVGFMEAGRISGCTYSGYVTAGTTTGGIVGLGGSSNYITIEDCRVIYPSNITDKSIRVTGKSPVGGIAGTLQGSINRSYVEVSVSGDSYVGGIVGEMKRADAWVSDCYTTGNITATAYSGRAAGIAAKVISTSSNACALRRCYSTGSITTQHSSATYIGGIAGNSGSSPNDSSIDGCFALNTIIKQAKKSTTGSQIDYISGNDSCGSVANYHIPISITQNGVVTSGNKGTSGNLITQAQAESQAIYEKAEWDFSNTWVMDKSKSKYPTLRYWKSPSYGVIPPLYVGKKITIPVIIPNPYDRIASVIVDDPNIIKAEISGKNIILHGLKVGRTPVTIKTALGEIIWRPFDVFAIEATSISISRSHAIMTVGDTLALDVTIKPDDTTDKSVVWKSSNTNIAEVSPTGLVTAIRSGEVTITANTNNNKIYSSCSIKVEPKIECINIALNKKADSITVTGIHKPANAIDGNFDTRWGATNWKEGVTENQTLVIDLEDEYDIHTIKINEAFDRITSYKIQYLDGSSYVDIATGSAIGLDYQIDFESVTTSRVKLVVLSTKRMEGGTGASISEFEIYACVPVEDIPIISPEPPMHIPVNLALTSSIKASTTSSAYKASSAIDGNVETIWTATTADKQSTLTIDFGKDTTINMVKLIEGYIRISSFKLEYYDGKEWLDILIGGKIGKDYETVFQDITTRIIRLSVLEKSDSRGASIAEFEIYYIK